MTEFPVKNIEFVLTEHNLPAWCNKIINSGFANDIVHSNKLENIATVKRIPLNVTKNITSNTLPTV
jgi:hypothetical protein